MELFTILPLLGLTEEQVTWLLAIVSLLFAVSEALALIPSVRANSVFQLVYNLLAKMIKKKGATL